MPERSSYPVKDTVTSLLFQPLPFASGVRLVEAEGLVLSMLIRACVSEAVLPEVSSQVPVAD